VDHIFTILIVVGIGTKEDSVEPIKNIKKVAIVIIVNQKKYVNIVMIGNCVVIVIVIVV